MFGSRVQNEVEMQRRNARIFPDEQMLRPDRLGVNRVDKTKAFVESSNRGQKYVLDPSSNDFLVWNRIFLVSCLFALFIDPFFYFIPLFVVNEDNTSCVRKDEKLSITITVLRSLADLFYMLNIAVKFNTAYVSPNSRVLGKGELVTDPKEIRRQYIRSPDFVRDILAAVPLPQILLWGVMPAINGSDYNVRNTTFGVVLVFQYAFRMYLIVPLSNKIIKAAGVVAKTAWGGAAYNLLYYMLASHITGAIYYLLTVERQITCWNNSCLQETNNTACERFLNCDYAKNSSDSFSTWASSTGVFNNCNASNSTINFNFGIFKNALSFGAASTTFHEKYFYCLYWGLQQLSSSGNPLQTSTFIAENTFAIAIGAVSLILFAQLIGNMQTYLQSMNKRQEEWRLRQRDTEEWMAHHQLPPELQKRVRRFVQVKWFATRGVEEESILQALPSDIRRDVQRHLCLDLVRRVPFFSQMDEQLLDAICERLVSCLCPEGTYVAREGDPVSEMLFIIRGTLESNTTNGGRSNFFNSIRLNAGDFCGEELLTWALMPKTHDNFPSSTRDVKALTEVEAFALRAEDLKFVANQFRRLHSRKLQHTFRFYSHTWRLWAACFIQAAWRQYKRRTMAESLSHWEETYTWWPEDEDEDEEEEEGHFGHMPGTERGESSNSGVIGIADAAAQIHKLAASASRRFLTDDATAMVRLQKPDEPDFSADHLD
ncbi:cyclic nucleotide-gated channel 6 [Rhynchospora pubera]|uniref:Cyclic nucleotide-gated channel 6 n=1 Tax=Rhynchospora pubera TaxID=906938 RepID=A0AAV8DX97_9POAL|nr:cyclic nucleotide-gated channel 6 [Rhynchospora pubera]